MSHLIDVRMVADQEIEICGRKVNIHNIHSIQVNSVGVIMDAYIEPEGETYTGWLSQEKKEDK